MLVSILVLMALSAAAVIGSVVVTARDGHRRVPATTSTSSLQTVRVER